MNPPSRPSRSSRRVCLGVAGLLALAVACSGAFAQTAERPVVRTGDWWRFVEYYSVPSTQPNRHWVVTSVTGERLTGTENGQPLALTPHLDVVDSPRVAYSRPGWLDFPLERGRTWRFQTDWLFKATGSSGKASVNVEVVGYEKIGVPAGEFDAFKLVSKAGMRGASPKGSLIDAEVVSTYWYAPAARAVVKSVTHNPYIGVITVELVSHGP